MKTESFQDGAFARCCQEGSVVPSVLAHWPSGGVAVLRSQRVGGSRKLNEHHSVPPSNLQLNVMIHGQLTHKLEKTCKKSSKGCESAGQKTGELLNLKNS